MEAHSSSFAYSRQL